MTFLRTDDTVPGTDGARADDARSPASGRMRREAAVTGAAFLVCLIGGLIHVDGTVGPSATAWFLAVLSCVALPVRHRAPVAAVVATTAAGLVAQPLGLLLSPLVIAPAVVAAYSLAEGAWSVPGARRAGVVPGVRRARGAEGAAGARRAEAAGLGERGRVGAVLAGSAVVLAVAAPLAGDVSWQDASRVGAVAAFPLVAGLLGHSVRNRRAYLAAVEDRARRAEESRESEARRRVAEERVRIARELHDLVAHQITLANAQATVAAHLFDTRPEQTRTSLRELVETTSHALDELRATVGLLRQAGDSAAPAEPAPGLCQLPGLLESFRRAGLDVRLHHDGPARALPPGADLTAYRIVQEALTNVTKHAATGNAEVRLAWSPDRITVTVADEGPDERADRPGNRADHRRDRDLQPEDRGGGRKGAAGPDGSTGYGLIGMRERATAAGGQLTAGPGPGGGFLVTADLPLPLAKEKP